MSFMTREAVPTGWRLASRITQVALVAVCALGAQQCPKPPTISSFVINNGAAETSLGSVTLNTTCSGSPKQIMASESPSFAGASWQSYSSAKSFRLSPGEAAKTVYVKVKNSKGTSAVASDAIQMVLRYSFSNLGGGASGLSVSLDNGGNVSINNLGQIEWDSVGTCYLWDRTHGLQTLGSLNNASTSSSGGVNDSGCVAGNARLQTQNVFSYRVFQWTSGGGWQDMGNWGIDRYLEVAGVNDNGAIVGFREHPGSSHTSPYVRGFVWDPTNGIHDLGALGSGTIVNGDVPESWAFDVSDTNIIVGSAEVRSGSDEIGACKWDAQYNIQALGKPLGGRDSCAVGVNSAGDVVGWCNRADGNTEPCLWRHDGTSLGLGLLGGTLGSANAINDNGVVVGSAVGPGLFKAFRWDEAHGTRDLATLTTIPAGWSHLEPDDINANGEIAGHGCCGPSPSSVFYLRPMWLD